MQQSSLKTTVQVVASAIAVAAVTSFFLLKVTSGTAQSSAGQAAAARVSQPFEDPRETAQYFADELGRLKEENRTTSPAELVDRPDANNRRDYTLPASADSGVKLDPESIYARAKSGVVIVGGIFKCTKCNRWHIHCASGFVIRRDGWIVTNLHVLESLKKLEALGIMTDNGRVFPIKAVLASSALNDLVLLKADTESLSPLPLSADIAVGATVFCISHPSLPGGKGNVFSTFTRGSVCGKSIIHNEKNEPLKVLAVTADYGPGSSGGPILNERGEVVGVACQAIPLFHPDHEKDVQMIWKFARPSCSILDLLSPQAAERKSSEENILPTAERKSSESKTLPAVERKSSDVNTMPAVARSVVKTSSLPVRRELQPSNPVAGNIKKPNPSDRTKGNYHPDPAKLTLGNLAPAFVANGLEGGTIDLKAEAARSKYVLIDFWASWCGPCRREFPTMRRIYARYRNYGLKVIGVTLDSDKSKAINAAHQESLSYSHVFDGKGWSNAVAQLYRVHGIPQVFLVDSHLKIVAMNLRGEELEKRLCELLGPGDEAAANAAGKAVRKVVHKPK